MLCNTSCCNVCDVAIEYYVGRCLSTVTLDIAMIIVTIVTIVIAMVTIVITIVTIAITIVPIVPSVTNNVSAGWCC